MHNVLLPFRIPGAGWREVSSNSVAVAAVLPETAYAEAAPPADDRAPRNTDKGQPVYSRNAEMGPGREAGGAGEGSEDGVRSSRASCDALVTSPDDVTGRDAALLLLYADVAPGSGTNGRVAG